MNGFEAELRNKILGINSHIVLMEYGGSIKDYKKVMREIEEVEGVIASTPFIYSQAMLKRGRSVSGVVLRGLSTESAKRVINLGKMEEGSVDYLSEKGRNTIQLKADVVSLPGIVIGKELAKNLGAFLFDTVSVLSPMGVSTPMGMVPRMKKCLVVGIFDSGFYEYDSSLAFLSLKECQKFLNMDDIVTGI